ncbi:MAG: universal stress protein [Halofilum sp. (in: g-proteobacteria)]|nr:universal stress protein [Halofilum sp. (in: g-proteobacteria)]
MMGAFKGIVVAADGSEPAQRAVQAAARMSAAEGTPLYLLHVVRDMQFPQALSRMAEVERLVGSRQDVLNYVADKILKEARETAKKAGAKSVETVTANGDPATQIIATANDKGADLIVMGTRGLSGMAGALLGSVSRKVSNMADQNVLIVR